MASIAGLKRRCQYQNPGHGVPVDGSSACIKFRPRRVVEDAGDGETSSGQTSVGMITGGGSVGMASARGRLDRQRRESGAEGGCSLTREGCCESIAAFSSWLLRCTTGR